jgi:hypothetical protein
VITLEHTVRAQLLGQEGWRDYGDGIALASPIAMKPLDAVLED